MGSASASMEYASAEDGLRRTRHWPVTRNSSPRGWDKTLNVRLALLPRASVHPDGHENSSMKSAFTQKTNEGQDSGSTESSIDHNRCRRPKAPTHTKLYVQISGKSLLHSPRVAAR